jgi:hypothetical protein
LAEGASNGDAKDSEKVLECGIKVGRHSERLMIAVQRMLCPNRQDFQATVPAVPAGDATNQREDVEVKTLYVYGQLHTGKGEPQEAREKYEQALLVCDRLGDRLTAAPSSRR